jgi:periplasmic protein CpxP/Spy
MSEQSASPSNPDEPKPGRGRSRRWLLVSMVALAAALTGAVASRAIGSPHAFGPSFMGGAFDPAGAEDLADRMTRHLAIEIDATNDQQEKLRTIVKGAVKDLLPMREKMLSTRQRAQALLTGPAVDRAAIEALRAGQIALADAASKRFAQALGDAAEVLTAEQRRKIDDRLNEMRERRGFWRGWHRG